jgi:hypothetical protein
MEDAHSRLALRALPVTMTRRFLLRLLTALIGCFFLLHPRATLADQIPVHYQEGVKHGFLSLRSVEGKLLADGELAQTAQGDRVTDVLTFRFKDGSAFEETTVFSQRGSFRLLTDHVDEKGPAFPHPMETSIDTATGEVTVRTKGDNGQEEKFIERLSLPADVANGLFFVLLKNIPAKPAETLVSQVVFTPKPHLANLAIAPRNDESVSKGAIRDQALHYTLQFRMGAVAGWFAALTGKKPADLQGWVLRGQAPELVKFEGQFYAGGPVWRIEMSAPQISAREP